MSVGTMRRFYKVVTVDAGETGFQVRLDGKPVLTPARHPLLVRSAALAEAIAAEWSAQEQYIRPETMPMMQLACTCADRLTALRGLITDELLNYLPTDLLCYRAESPNDLVARQTALWQPLLDWFTVWSGGVVLPVTTGLVPPPQDPTARDLLRARLDRYDAPTMTALQASVLASGSLVLGLAQIEGKMTAAEVFAASQLDETYQIELWGEDPEATKRRAALAEDLAATDRFLKLSRMTN